MHTINSSVIIGLKLDTNRILALRDRGKNTYEQHLSGRERY